MNDRERIGNKIKEIRIQKGISTYQLAELTGLNQPNIVRIEKGKYSTGIDIISKIVNSLGCQIDIIDRKE